MMELLIAMAIIALLATFTVSQGVRTVETTRFTRMKTPTSQLIVSEQNHRQIHGRYATQINSSGQASASTLVFRAAEDYNI
ncbi:MAG: hypothetical protein HC848_02945, partial [Limnobacter sp.]|nr:hypothetical protein [Limnobacter sp.]